MSPRCTLTDKDNGEQFQGTVLDTSKFLSLVLDWQLTGYLKAVTSLHDRIDELDEKLLQISPSEETLLQRLLELRREVRRLRDLLASHREVLGLLSHNGADRQSRLSCSEIGEKTIFADPGHLLFSRSTWRIRGPVRRRIPLG